MCECAWPKGDSFRDVSNLELRIRIFSLAACTIAGEMSIPAALYPSFESIYMVTGPTSHIENERRLVGLVELTIFPISHWFFRLLNIKSS